MSRSINALVKGDLQRGLNAATKDVQKLTAELTGANSEPVVKASRVLLGNWKRIVNVPGGGEPAAPGEPPRRQTRKLVRSFGSRVVEGVRRVGSGDFVARLQEFGYTAKDGTSVPARPHGRVAIEISKDEMVDVTVSEMQRRIAKG